ncbi:SAP domain-containing protein [Eubacterium ruminantium]|uniref:SAP domain-containing protein n=1 Tax=Eubacterium ruminantium TaxID=42322 RepID=UPI00156A37B6|nr:SAP domain-containing protein [Eubacterium ruminantium]
MVRPEFESIRDYDEFCKYYWYREELVGICKAHGLKCSGSKIELNTVIKAYFSGEKILPEKKKVRQRGTAVKDLTLQTGLIECGFTFGNRFRDFFSEQTGVKPFKFNVDMVETVKVVKATEDENFTLGDLLDIYYGGDEATKVYSGRLKAAAALWKIVRESDLKKEYSHELLEEYKDIIDIK